MHDFVQNVYTLTDQDGFYHGVLTKLYFAFQIAPNKGVSHLIDIENPNRATNKMKKASRVDVNESGTTALSRRER